MENINDLRDLLVLHVRNLYDAEEQIMQAMPSIIEKAHHSSLKNALTHHLGLTHEQKKRLGKILKLQNKKDGFEPQESLLFNHDFNCKGITGLIEEANEVLNNNLSAGVMDSAIIACVQKLEHYEICSYGSALAFAVQLHQHEVEELLKETLDEEYDADDLLTALATSALNKEAAHLEAGAEQAEAEKEGDRSDAAALNTTSRVSISERTINSPGGRAGTSHRGYNSGESRGH